MLQDASFSTEVTLPCRLAYGPDFKLETSGVTSRIDPRNLTVVVSSSVPGLDPSPGDTVQLQILLPAIGATKHAKCLVVRAHVMHVSDDGNGVRRFHLGFRRASFREVKFRPGLHSRPEEAAWRM